MAAIERRERFRPDRIGWLLIILICWQALAALVSSIHLDRSLIFLLWQAKYLLVFLLVRNLQLTEKLAGQIKAAVLLAIGLQAGLAMAQQVTDGILGLVVLGEQDPSRLFFVKSDMRVSGTLGATNAFAGYMATLLVFALPYLFRRQKLHWYALHAAGVIALIFTFSRAGWLSFIVGGGLVIIAMIRAGIVRPSRLLAMCVLGLVVVGSGVVTYFDEVQIRFQDREALRSAEGRLTQFGEFWPVVEAYPVFGIGPGVTEYFGAWNDNARYVRQSLGGLSLSNQPHSSQLQYWIESGTPAFVLWMLLFLAVYRTALSRPSRIGTSPDLGLLRIGAAGAAAAIMTDATFGTEINSYQISLVFWIFLALARNSTQERITDSTLAGVERLGVSQQQLRTWDPQFPWTPRR